MTTESQQFTATLRLENLDDTTRLGARIAGALAPGDVVALHGDLGAGKTALARTILQALGVTGPMPSPTFTLVQSYETARLLVHHYDLYRIEDESELEELGFEDCLNDGAALIEWPERAGTRLPSDALQLRLTIADGEARTAEITGPERWATVFTPKEF
jgi:tRNA threonylcarbamoyl adenosine modification protein YjeE